MHCTNNRFTSSAPIFHAAVITASILLAACGAGGGDSRVSSSGNPEADRRAEVRVGGGGGRDRNADDRPLYERLGGEEKIAAIVDDMLERSIADPRVNFERKNVKTSWLNNYEPWQPTPQNVERVRRHMIQFFSLAAGGPAEYSGRDMTVAHKGMRITNEEFDAMVGDIKTSMEKLEVPRREMREFLAIVETTRKQIVEKR